jgi:hypothetical protein
VLIRPHPFNSEAWESADLSDLGPVAIWPRARYTPASEASRDGFFDSLYYSAAVVGINTSAMIEAAILRKPVLSLLVPQFAGTQEGTLHFRYLLPENGGFLRVASTVAQHLDQLAEVIQHQDVVREELDRFVGSFIRPHGSDQACTPRLADALERAANPIPAQRDALFSCLLRALMVPLAGVVAVLSPELNAEGRAQDRWTRRIGPYLQRLRKRLFTRPLRLAVGTLRSSPRTVAKRLRRARRWPSRIFSRLRDQGRPPRVVREDGGSVPNSDRTDGS